MKIIKEDTKRMEQTRIMREEIMRRRPKGTLISPDGMVHLPEPGTESWKLGESFITYIPEEGEFEFCFYDKCINHSDFQTLHKSMNEEGLR